jgi:hypothetical protein
MTLDARAFAIADVADKAANEDGASLFASLLAKPMRPKEPPPMTVTGSDFGFEGIDRSVERDPLRWDERSTREFMRYQDEMVERAYRRREPSSFDRCRVCGKIDCYEARGGRR